MVRPSARILGPLALVAALTQLGIFASAFLGLWSGRDPFQEIESASVGRSALGLLLVAFVGRVVLAWLPSGPQGSHAPRDLPRTWALSHLLGLFALGLEQRLLGGEASTLARLAPWLILALLRVATRPAAMVPRHDPPSERTPRAIWIPRLLFALWALGMLFADLVLDVPPADLFAALESRLLPAVSAGGPSGPGDLSITVVGWIALWILLDDALFRARRGPSGRALALPVAATAWFPLNMASPAALALGLGACALVPWLRRADRRAGALSAIAFAALFVWGRPLLALAGLLVLVSASPEPMKRFAAGVGLLSGALFLASAGFDVFQQTAVAPAIPDGRRIIQEALSSSFGIAWILAIPTIVASFAALAPRRRMPEPDAIEDTVRETRALLGLLCLALLVLLPRARQEGTLDLLVTLYPLIALLGGLVWIRTEEPRPAI